MSKSNLKYNSLLNKLDLSDVTNGIKIGFEKESLRVNGSCIASSPHPKSLGASLCNRYITMDFSEAQLELITPPLKGKTDSLLMLDDIHHYVQYNIENETLWPLSMPPTIHSQNDIPIAKFGSSHEGIFKHIYRKGLSERYGKSMQAISGLHFNYSLPKSIWTFLAEKSTDQPDQIRSDVYFNMLRNIYKMNWILIYLFGASPVIGKSLLSHKSDSFSKLGRDNLFLPYSTSLRMSEYGYSNTDRKKIHISINSLEGYANDLFKAITTLEPRYLKFEKKKDLQLNPNILQIEAEYYAVARAKSTVQDSIRPSINLKKKGVDFIEIRSLDLNPFSKIGIDSDTVLFLEVFMLYCLVTPCKEIDKESMKIIQNNDSSVSKFGRKPNLKIFNDKKILMKEWGERIIDDMVPIAEILGNKDQEYLRMINLMKSRILEPEETPSARILSEIKSAGLDHDELGDILAKKHKDEYLSKDINKNRSWQMLENEKERSINLQKDLERKTIQSGMNFDEFKKDYLKT